MKNKKLQLWAPWVLLVAILALWQFICTAFNVSEFIFPSPLRIATQTWEFKEVILGHARRTYWVTMLGFGIAIVVGVLLGFVVSFLYVIRTCNWSLGKCSWNRWFSFKLTCL